MRTLLRTTGPAVLALLLFQPTTGRADPIVISSGTIAGHELGSTLVEVPFTFTGVMNGFLEHPLIRPSDALPIFTVDLNGGGRASARFFGLVDDNGVRAYSVFPDSIRYEFTTSEPVPEPGTLLLVGGALGVLILVRFGLRRGPGDRATRG
jgi:hypothetical protein